MAKRKTEVEREHWSVLVLSSGESVELAEGQYYRFRYIFGFRIVDASGYLTRKWPESADRFFIRQDTEKFQYLFSRRSCSDINFDYRLHLVESGLKTVSGKQVLELTEGSRLRNIVDGNFISGLEAFLEPHFREASKR